MVQKTYTPLGLDMGACMFGDLVQKTYTPLGSDMGTWGLGDMGFRGHGTDGV